MNFSSDRDLLAYEPQVFTDVPFAAQQRVSVADGELGGTTLTSASADFAAAQVDAGDVVLIAGLAHEVLSRTDAHTLEVSLPRTNLTDAAIPSHGGTQLAVQVRTFAPQAAVVHDELLRLLRMDPDDPQPILTEDAIVSLSLMSRLEALGTLARLYAGGVAVIGDNAGLQRKEAEYRGRFREACAAAVVRLDTDGDGFADEQRRIGASRMERV